jgi:FkbM family methyltransferase
MLGRAKSAVRRLVRELAALPLRSLGEHERSKIVEDFIASMISDVVVGSHTIHFMAPTPVLLARARGALSKEPDTINWLDLMAADDVLWDIGANVGVFSFYAAVVRGVRVLAFEPSAGNYMVLCKNVEINALGDRVLPYCLALSGATTLGVLNCASSTLGVAQNQFGRPGVSSPYWSTSSGFHAQGMVGFTADDFVRQFEPTFPNYIKIDVDGLELDILRGATKTLRDHRLKSVMVELIISDDAERNAGIKLLHDAGLELESQGELQENSGVTAVNHLFVRKPA